MRRLLLLGLLLAGCGESQPFQPLPVPVVASVQVNAMAPVVLGTTQQAQARALDAAGQLIPGASGFVFRSSNPGRLEVSADGKITPIFAPFAMPHVMHVVVELTQDGVTLLDSVEVQVTGPPSEYGSILWSELAKPEPVPSLGIGVALFARREGMLDYTVAWSALTAPASMVHLRGPVEEDEVGALLAAIPAFSSALHGSVRGSLTAGDILPVAGQPPIPVDSLASLMIAGKVHVEVISVAYPAGEVRGSVGKF